MADKTQVNPEKLKVLSAVMDKIEKDFGKGAIMKMSSKAVEIVPVIRSGSITPNMRSTALMPRNWEWTSMSC